MGVIVNVFQYVKVLSWCTFHMWTRPGYGSFLTLACLMDIDMYGLVLLPKPADAEPFFLVKVVWHTLQSVQG